MQKRKLGRTGLDISPVVFGGNVFGWTADEKTSFALLDGWLDAGFNTIDTADVYSSWAPGNKGGESETIIGKWLKQSGRKRDDVVIVTKVGSDMGNGNKGLKAGWINKAVEDSLRRLQTDHIDLYLSHWPDPETPYEETLAAFDALKKAGKIRAIGCSNLDASQLAESLKVAKDEACRVTTSCSRNTISTPARNSRVRWPISASPRILASSPISVSPRAS